MRTIMHLCFRPQIEVSYGGLNYYFRKASVRNFSCIRVHRTVSSTEADIHDGIEVTAESAKSGELEPVSRNAASHSHRKAFCKWLSTKGAALQNVPARSGTNYLDGKTYPFPLNPLFQPKAPLSPVTKSSLCKDWTSGLRLQQLSLKYGISLERVEAILKLHQVSLRWHEEGRATLTSYSETMSSMLGVVDTNDLNYEQATNVPIDPGRQIFTLIPESSDYTSQDAARDLGRMPFAEKSDRYIRAVLKKSAFQRQSAFARLTKKKLSNQVARTCQPRLGGKCTYNFRDTATKRTITRTKTGDLLLRAGRTDNIHRPIEPSKWTNI